MNAIMKGLRSVGGGFADWIQERTYNWERYQQDGPMWEAEDAKRQAEEREKAQRLAMDITRANILNRASEEAILGSRASREATEQTNLLRRAKIIAESGGMEPGEKTLPFKQMSWDKDKSREFGAKDTARVIAERTIRRTEEESRQATQAGIAQAEFDAKQEAQDVATGKVRRQILGLQRDQLIRNVAEAEKQPGIPKGYVGGAPTAQMRSGRTVALGMELFRKSINMNHEDFRDTYGDTEWKDLPSEIQQEAMEQTGEQLEHERKWGHLRQTRAGRELEGAGQELEEDIQEEGNPSNDDEGFAPDPAIEAEIMRKVGAGETLTEEEKAYHARRRRRQ